jgi:FkbM family methyltransferase
VGEACARHLALPGYVRRFSTSAGGVEITIGSRPRVSLVGYAYYRGLEDFEPNTVGLFAALARKARTIVDVGANIGIFSLVAARVHPQSRILAFEPQPMVAMSLARNVALSEAFNVEVFPSALGSVLGYAALYTTVSDVLSSLDQKRVPDAIKLTVPATTLDVIVKENSVVGVDLVKIDAEGWELQVLEGAASTLARDRPTVVFEALVDSPAVAIAAIFDKLGYGIWAIAEKRLEKVDLCAVAGKARERNFVAIPQERSAQVLVAPVEW